MVEDAIIIKEHERGKIEGMLKSGYSKRAIAKELCKSDTAVRKEIRRGTVELPRQIINQPIIYGYIADTAQWRYDRNRKRQRQLKIELYPELIKIIVDVLEEHRRNFKPWSINALIGRMNLFPEEFGNLETKICFKTAYNYLHSNRVEPINKKYLFYYKNKKIKQPRPAKRINGLSIDERPKNVNERKEFGHHELDTMKSVRGDDTCLLNIVERVSRFTRLRKMESCDARHTILTIDKLERKKQIVTGGTCTTDNGPEVSDVNGLEKSVVSGKRMEMYYAKPYHAWEKGTVEQSNGMYRLVIPKKTKIRDLSNEEIQDIEDWQNDYPRKQFGFKTAREIYNHFVQKFLNESGKQVRTF